MITSHRTSGFTLLEMLVVMAIMAVLTAIVWGPTNRYLVQTKVKEAAQQFASDVQSQHFEAKRLNTTRTIEVAASSRTYKISNVNYRLPDGVVFSSSSTGTVTFHGPYGTTLPTSGTAGPNLQSFTLVSSQNASVSRTVTVVGLIGKVIVK